ncbi:hypothetical protein Tco_1308379, partial [Tanacetum coccineum]
HYARDCPQPKVHDAKYFREHMLLAMKDEAGVNLNEEGHDFMLDNHYGDDLLEELNAVVITMTMMMLSQNMILRLSLSITFDDPYVDNNGGTDEHDSNDHDQSVALESLIYSELETCKELVRTLEKQPVKSINYKEAYEELEREIRVDKDKIDNPIKEKDKTQDEFFQLENETGRIRHETELSKKTFKEREKVILMSLWILEKNLVLMIELFTKWDNQFKQFICLGKKPNKVYDPFLKAGLGYQNPKRLKKAIKAQPKMYDGEILQSTKLITDSPDSEETLEDAEESRLKMKDKMIQLDYEKLNALYEIFFPQTKIHIEQTYLSTPSTSNVPFELSIDVNTNNV